MCKFHDWLRAGRIKGDESRLLSWTVYGRLVLDVVLGLVSFGVECDNVDVFYVQSSDLKSGLFWKRESISNL